MIYYFQTHATKPFFYDKQGRVRIFHGVNAVKKSFPWYEASFLQDDRLDDLKEWGLNVVRLGVMWAGTEPEERSYNSTYIGIIKGIVQRLGQRGIYTLLDMHQDCATSRFESYDGFPRWLIDKFPESPNPFPWPQEKITFWEEKYFTQAVSRVFQHVYNNTADALDKWSAFWRYVAQQFKDEPYVLGYNVINEPWVGDYFQEESLFWPGNAGRVNLAPSYEQINQCIRQVDNETIFFYEPVMYGMILHDPVLGSGFTQVPGGDDYRNVSAYSYHAYCWPLEFIDSGAPDQERKEAKELCDNEFLPGIMEAQRDNIKQTGGASMLTEYGLCHTHEPGINIRCEDIMNLCDRFLQSWTDWDYADYKWYNNNEQVMAKIKPYIRPYAQSVAGTPTNMTFDPKTESFTFEFDLDPSINAASEIFLPRLRYSDYTITVTENLRFDVLNQTLYLFPNAGVSRVVKASLNVTKNVQGSTETPTKTSGASAYQFKWVTIGEVLLLKLGLVYIWD